MFKLAIRNDSGVTRNLALHVIKSVPVKDRYESKWLALRHAAVINSHKQFLKAGTVVVVPV